MYSFTIRWVLKTGVTLRIDSRINCSQASGKFAVGLGVIKRNDLVLEQLVKTAGVDFVLKFDRAVVDLGADGPAVVAVVTLAPPAIEHAQVQARRSARSFIPLVPLASSGRKRMIQPKIDTLHEAARDVAVVIFQKHDAVFECRLRG